MQRLDKCDQCKNKDKCGDSGCPAFEAAEESEFQKAFRQWLRGKDYGEFADGPWAEIERRWAKSISRTRSLWLRALELAIKALVTVTGCEACDGCRERIDKLKA
ncbi:MAG TPA: hypothetical protein ENH94_00365 [Phycisphaerales bacterium]|nr:hypothetical protein [Phycisphaerales bacterium]